MMDTKLKKKLLDALESLWQLPLNFFDRVPKEIWEELGEEQIKAIITAVEEETQAKFDAIWAAIEPILDEEHRQFWESAVLRCLRAGRRDLLAKLPPEAEQAITVLQAQALLRNKPPK